MQCAMEDSSSLRQFMGDYRFCRDDESGKRISQVQSCRFHYFGSISNLDASEEEWHEFSEDPTMCHVGELFAKYYRKDSRHELDGIIQIFNLFYLRDAKLERALEVVKSMKTYSWPTCEEDIELIINSPGPVYLGFGQLAHDELLSRRARMFYDAVKTRMSYLKESFEANKFYHPAYLMGRGRNRDCAKLALTDFCEQSCADFK